MIFVVTFFIPVRLMSEKKRIMQPDDDTIVRQCLEGDRESFSILVERYGELAYNMAYRMLGDGDAANDMAQESFIAAYGALRGFKRESRFSSWIASIVLNKCRDYLRAAKRSAPLDAVENVLPDHSPTPEEWASTREQEEDLQEALNKLPAEYREAVILKHVEGFEYREMERILGVRADTLKVRVHRAREMLKDLILEREKQHG